MKLKEMIERVQQHHPSMGQVEIIRYLNDALNDMGFRTEIIESIDRFNTVANQRLAFSKLRSKVAVAKLFNELGPRYKERPGGYLRVIKSGLRSGDKAPSAQVEFVDKQTDVPLEEILEDSTS